MQISCKRSHVTHIPLVGRRPPDHITSDPPVGTRGPPWRTRRITSPQIANLKTTIASNSETPSSESNRGSQDEEEEGRQTYRRPDAHHSYASRFPGNITQSAHHGRTGRSRPVPTPTHRQNLQSAESGRTRRENTGGSTRTGIGQSKCLLIHDGTFSNFDKDRFTKRYEVETVKCPSIRNATVDTTIPDKIGSYKPGLIVMHLGYADIHEGREVEEVVSECKALIRSLCKKGKTCLSLPLVPQNTEHAEFCEKVQLFSDTMADYITNLRREKAAGDYQVFTSHPGPLNSHVKIISELPEAKITTDYGKILLWIKFRDSLDRMTGRLLPRRRAPDNSTDTNNES